ncbi:SARP family transcriptional regulator [Rhizocola hellebori]|uniref:SARP family transcriptional regulator n=1 Tax=Rhizocola hellebori TaxID=1392758 RepID=A0A8J3Q1Y4_9ACTN|nr:SARP family transcriptional regulator [Rhizocola hellebori]
MLGSLAIEVDGQLRAVARPRTRAVLARLLLSANRLVTTESLVDALWGQAPPATARSQIQTAVSAVRQALRDMGCENLLKTSFSGYQLDVAPADSDLIVFTTTIEQARRVAEEDPAEAAHLIKQALLLWRGPALSEVVGSFVDSARAGLQEQYLTAVERLAELQLRMGRHEEVAVELAPVAKEHPRRESLVRSLALALHRCGRRADALAVLQAQREHLVEEFGTDPAPATCELEQSIQRADPHLDRIGSVSTTVSGPGINSLPTDVAGFSGRRSHLTDLDTAAAALVTITGSGGIGKTALALHWAHRAVDRYPDGVLYVDLHGFGRQQPSSPVQALSRLLYQLGVPPEQIPSQEGFAVDLYRSRAAGKRLLVVVDNARDCDQVRPLLPNSLTSRTLVTSRHELSGLVARDGAHCLRLSVLNPAEALELLARSLPQASPAVLHELARLCAYVPLALRIAAAAIATGTSQDGVEYVAGLRTVDRLSLLGVEGDDDTAVAATFDLSYAMLEPAVQRMFRLLSVVAGPDFCAQEAASLAGLPGPHALRLLKTLTHHHMVEERAPGRFGFHDLLRLYAAHLLEATDGGDARKAAETALAQHYLHHVVAAAHALYPQLLRLPADEADWPLRFADRPEAMEWLNTQRASLVASIVAFADQGHPEFAWRLADGMRGYFFLRMFPVEWQSVAEAGLRAAQAQGDHHGQAAAHLNLADFYGRQGFHDLADRAFGSAAEHAQAAGWREAEATIMGSQGGLWRLQGRPSEAAQLMERSLALNVEIGRLDGQGVNHGNLGALYGELGDYAKAQEHLQRSLAHYSGKGVPMAEAFLLTSLGELALWRGELSSAEEYVRQGFAMHEELADTCGQAVTTRVLAEVQVKRGNFAAALELMESAIALANDSDDRWVQASCLQAQALALRSNGSLAEALPIATRAVELAREVKHVYAEARALIELAEVQSALGETEQAVSAARRAHLLASGAGYTAVADQASGLIGFLTGALA